MTTIIRTFIRSFVASWACAATLAAGQGDAARWPTRPVRIVVGLSAGGPTDILARIVGQALSDKLGQPVIIENRPGAGGDIAMEAVVHSAPDGYTLFMATSGPMSINATLYGNLGYDPLKDLAPITGIASAPFVVCVNPNVPVKSMKELVAYAKAHPGKLNYGAVTGSASHLATALFTNEADIEMTFIPYKGAAPAATDLLAGQIDLSFLSTPGAVPYMKAGKLRGLGVTSARRIDQAKDLPTIGETVLPGYEASVWYGLVAPSRTPKAIVERLHREVAAIVKDPEVVKRMRANDFEPTGLEPAQFGEFMQAESAKWGKVVKALGLKAN